MPAKATKGEGAPSRLVATTGKKPLTKSPPNVMAAAFLPPIRMTFVAPGLPEPCSRGSGKFINLQTIMALEIEPIKYARGMINPKIMLHLN